MNNTRGRAAVSLLVALGLLFSFGLGALSSWVLVSDRATGPGDTGPQPTAESNTQPGNGNATVTPSQKLDDQMKQFYDVLSLLKKESYYKPIDQQKLVYGAIEGMMHAVGDDYTRYETPSQAAQTNQQMQGESFGGVGLYIETVDTLPTIAGPIPNTPAARAGLRAHDLILKVDGRDVTQLPLDDLVQLVRGKEGTKVRLTISRNAQTPFDVELTREIINVPQVSTDVRDDGIAVLTVSIFGEKTTEQLDAGLKDIKAKNAKGIILDLRNNGGGFVTDAQQMLGRFISPDVGKKYGDAALYYSFDATKTNLQTQKIIRDGEAAYDIPMVVLVNGGTASASEITAGALSDYGRAILIGEQTFGKGSVQNVHDLPDGSSARITIAHWLSPAKRDINPRPTATAVPSATSTPLPTFTPTPVATATALPPGITPTATPPPVKRDRGISPDIEIFRTDSDFAKGLDPQVDRAVQYLQTGK
jgi:carboxyl-terminal processing protease